jgi:ABC transporter substrate binding protein
MSNRNVAFEYRWVEGRYERPPALADDLVGRKVDVIVTGGGSPAAHAAKRATSSIPIVFVGGGDPVADGLVASLARPGGNLTGIDYLVTELSPKRRHLSCRSKPQRRPMPSSSRHTTRRRQPDRDAPDLGKQRHSLVKCPLWGLCHLPVTPVLTRVSYPPGISQAR